MTALVDKQTASLIITVLLALSGYLITRQIQIRLSQRKDRLELINKRINEFYGPLYIALQDSLRSYQALLTKLHRQESFFEHGKQPTEDEMRQWRIWVEHVLMPLNLRVETIILEHAYLIREQAVPECLLQFVTHVSAYKAVLKCWEAGDFSEWTSIISFPMKLNAYAAEAYAELKEEQLKLIGKLR